MPQKRRRSESESDIDGHDDSHFGHMNCEDGLDDLYTWKSAAENPTRREQFASQSSWPPRAKLTTENLLLHTQAEDPSAKIAMPSASASERSAASKTKIDDEQALREIGVRFKSNDDPPPELAQQIRDVVQRRRGAPSPNAKQLAKIFSSSSRANESTVVGLVVPYLLFEDMLHRGGGEHHIIRKEDLNFDPRWVSFGKKKLATPRPDVTIGYILDGDTCGLTRALFDLDEETVLLRYAVNRDLLSPFLSSQLKSAFGAMPNADVQTTRDGYAVINATFAMLQAADERPTPVDLHHWSVTCDGTTAHLWLHWAVVERGFGLRHHSKTTLSTTLYGGDPRLDEMRLRLRNILDFALDRRVSRLKEVVKKIRNREASSHISFSDPGFVEGDVTSTPPQVSLSTPKRRPQHNPRSPPSHASQKTAPSGKKPRLGEPESEGVVRVGRLARRAC